MGGLRWRAAELHSHGSLIYFVGHFSVSFGQPFLFAGFRVHIRYISASLHVYAHLLAKMDSTEDASLTKEAKDLYTGK